MQDVGFGEFMLPPAENSSVPLRDNMERTRTNVCHAGTPSGGVMQWITQRVIFSSACCASSENSGHPFGAPKDSMCKNPPLMLWQPRKLDTHPAHQIRRTETWNAPNRSLDSRGTPCLRLGATPAWSRSRRPRGNHDGAARRPEVYSNRVGDLVGRALRSRTTA